MCPHRPDQVRGEVIAFLRMMGEVYNVFGLEYKMALSTRPEGYLGELDLWDKAEKALQDALDSTGEHKETCFAQISRRLVLAFHQWEMFQADIVNAFLVITLGMKISCHHTWDL